MADAISSSVVILDAGERPVVTNRGRVLRKYLQSISDLRQKADVSIAEVGAYASEFEKCEFGSETSLPSKIVEYIQKFEELQKQGLKPEKVNEGVSTVFLPHEGHQKPEARVSISSIYEPGIG